jgi:hypothetical protein
VQELAQQRARCRRQGAPQHFVRASHLEEWLQMVKGQ